MFRIIFTLDYEIHGNGDGSPHDLMIEPTDRMIRLFNKYGAKLTIMADVAEIMKFKEYKEQYSNDKYNFDEILNQLRFAVSTGHDVQLHIHSGYFNAQFDDNKIRQNWEEYDLANLSYETINERIKKCKGFLTDHLASYHPEYRCHAFRAANWSMVPTYNLYHALTQNGIEIDSSVFKWGKRSNRVCFDYSHTPDKLIPWFLDENDVCKVNPESNLLELPIYTELRNFTAFITPIRALRMFRARIHQHEKLPAGHGIKSQNNSGVELSGTNKSNRKNILKFLIPFINKHAWKLDFNQASGRQLIRALKRIDKEYKNREADLPIVLIGHSKSFIKYNETTLKPFLKYIQRHPEKFKFSMFKDIESELYRHTKTTQ